MPGKSKAYDRLTSWPTSIWQLQMVVVRKSMSLSSSETSVRRIRLFRMGHLSWDERAGCHHQTSGHPKYKEMDLTDMALRWGRLSPRETCVTLNWNSTKMNRIESLSLWFPQDGRAQFSLVKCYTTMLWERGASAELKWSRIKTQFSIWNQESTNKRHWVPLDQI